MPGRNGTGPPWWQGRFRGCGYRMTVPRQVILSVLNKTSKHLSAEDVYMAVRRSYSNVGLTTVYRTLELLVQMGLIFKCDFGDGRARYELIDGPKGERHHHHLVCTGCGTVIDYTDFIDDEAELLKRTEKGLSKKYNFDITNHLIQFYGVCGNCREQEKKGGD